MEAVDHMDAARWLAAGALRAAQDVHRLLRTRRDIAVGPGPHHDIDNALDVAHNVREAADMVLLCLGMDPPNARMAREYVDNYGDRADTLAPLLDKLSAGAEQQALLDASVGMILCVEALDAAEAS